MLAVQSERERKRWAGADWSFRAGLVVVLGWAFQGSLGWGKGRKGPAGKGFWVGLLWVPFFFFSPLLNPITTLLKPKLVEF